MKTKKKNGFVIELMIVFMLVTFAFCMVVTAFMRSLTTERKFSKTQIDLQTTLNQIGEYYMRSVEAGGIFPDKYDSIRNLNIKIAANKKYAWLDDDGNGTLNENDETVKFFQDNQKNIYTDEIYKNYGSILEFYKTKSVKRRLTVKNDNKIKLILTVNEVYIDKNASACEVLTWYVGDNLSEPSDGEDFTQTKLGTLQKLWKFFGETVSDISDAEKETRLLARIAQINGIVLHNWQEIFYLD